MYKTHSALETYFCVVELPCKALTFYKRFSSQLFALRSLLLISSILFSAFNVAAQWAGHTSSTDILSTINRKGNVLIGDGTAPVLLTLRGNDGVSAAAVLSFEDSQGTANQWFRFTNNTNDNRLMLSSYEVPNLMTFNRTTGAVGIGTPVPNSPLHVVSNNRHYYVDKPIPGTSPNSNGKSYILLHKAYTAGDAAMADHFVMGKVTGIRGGTSAWNRKVTHEVNTSSAYQSNRGSILSYNEPGKLVIVQHTDGFKYIAIEIASNSSVFYFSFTGYAANEKLEVVTSTIVEPFTELEPITTSSSQVMMAGEGELGNGAKPANSFLITCEDSGTSLNMGVNAVSPQYSWIQSRSRSSNMMMNLMINPWGGNVGVGAIASAPAATLHIGSGHLLIDGPNADPRIYTGVQGSDQNRYLLVMNSPTWPGSSGLKAGGILVSDGYDYANPPSTDLVVEGNVSIGRPTGATGYHLSVAGKAIAEEMVVQLKSTWPDFVFDSTYNLPPLSEVEAYIKTNKHLPEIPSEAEVKENGVAVGEMNALLLKKIEELTLYVIELEKSLKAQQNEINDLRVNSK